MSIVIVGGNERMARRYKDLCGKYKCDAKVYTKMNDGLQRGVGDPDLMVLFTGTMSHKMMRYVFNETKGQDTIVERCKTSSINALRDVLEKHVPDNQKS